MKFTIAKIFLVAFAFTLVFTSCFKDDLLKEIDTLRNQLSEMQKSNDDLNNILNARADLLSRALTNAQKRSDSLSNVLKTKSDSLTNALGITNAYLATLTKSVDSIKVQVANISGQLTQLNSQLTSITTQLTQLNQQMGALGADFATINAKYQELSTSLQNLNAQIAALQAEQLKLLERLNAITLQLNPPVDITTGLVAYYPFSGNAGDSSGNGNHGVIGVGITLTQDRFSNINSAYNFSGAGNISLKFLPTTGNQDFTVTGWVKSNNTNLRKGIICWGQDIPWASAYLFIDNSGRLKFDFAFNGGPQSSAIIADNQWHFVSVINSRGLIRLYVDGVSTGNTVQMSPNISGINKSIGSNIDNAGPNNFIGNLDDIRIYNRALSQSEITYLATH